MGLFGRDDHSGGDERTTAQVRGSQTTPGSSPQTVIAADNRFEGTIYGSGDVHVEGEIAGAVDISSGLLVAAKGTVRGTVSARRVTVAGTVVGDISASERIELNPSAKVEGNMTSARILINDGATFDGQVLMREPQPRSGKGKAQHPVTTSSARRDQPAKDEDHDQPAKGDPGPEPAAKKAETADQTLDKRDG